VNAEELLYAKTHEWVAIESDDIGEKVATVGLSAFAVEALTDLVHIELPEVGKLVSASEPFGEVESVKAVSDLYAPVGGEVIERAKPYPNGGKFSDTPGGLTDPEFHNPVVQGESDLGRPCRRVDHGIDCQGLAQIV